MDFAHEFLQVGHLFAQIQVESSGDVGTTSETFNKDNKTKMSIRAYQKISNLADALPIDFSRLSCSSGLSNCIAKCKSDLGPWHSLELGKQTYFINHISLFKMRDDKNLPKLIPENEGKIYWKSPI